MGEDVVVKALAPPASALDDSWHWLRHELNGTLIVSQWCNSTWATGQGWWDVSPVGGQGASSADMHKWGWRYYAPAVPPLSPIPHQIDATP